MLKEECNEVSEILDIGEDDLLSLLESSIFNTNVFTL